MYSSGQDRLTCPSRWLSVYLSEQGNSEGLINYALKFATQVRARERARERAKIRGKGQAKVIKGHGSRAKVSPM